MIPSRFTGARGQAFWALARTVADYSARAYRDATATDAATGASALVELDADGDIVVAFKGSSAAVDFLRDAECWRDELMSSRWETAEVHHGFLADFEAINMIVVSQVRAMLILRPPASIYITGHSLGGALAILCALEFARQKLPVAGVYTFGGPRVGNADFAALYNQAGPSIHGLSLKDITYRLVNQNDIVPRTPGWLLGYRHCGTEIFLEPITGWSVNPPVAYKVLCDVLGLYAAYRKKEDVLIKEHFLSAYSRRIANL